MNDQDSQRRVVIIGGGFAGLFAARVLRRAPVRVTLIDRRPHHLFQPLLYQCSTGILSEGKIAVPLRDLLRKQKNADFVLAEVTGIDIEGRRVLTTRPLGDQLEFGYDYLIVAAGVQQSYFGHDEFAPPPPPPPPLPVGPAPTRAKVSQRLRSAGSTAVSASSNAPKTRRRMTRACSMVFMPGAHWANSGRPEIGLLHPGRHDQVVIAELQLVPQRPRRQDPPPFNVDAGHLGQHEVRVLLLTEQVPQRDGDVPWDKIPVEHWYSGHSGGAGAGR